MAITSIVDKMTSLAVANLVPRRTNVYWVTSDDANEDPVDVWAAVNGGSYDLRKLWLWANKSDQHFYVASLTVELRQPDTSRFEWVVAMSYSTYVASSQHSTAPDANLQPEPI